MPMTKFEGQKLTKGAFVIEECFFVNCSLVDCDLFYSGGGFDWVNCRFDNCRWHWRGPAEKMFHLMATIGMLKDPQMPPTPPLDTSKLH